MALDISFSHLHYWMQYEISSSRAIREADKISFALSIQRFYSVKVVKVLKNHICKYGKIFDIILIDITREKWLSQKEKIFNIIRQFLGNK